jgi:hypothetical protein
MRPCQGSTWWALHRSAAEWIIQNTSASADRYFKRALVPDENYYQMLMDASPFSTSIIQDDLHYICWDGWHPRALRDYDLQGMVATDKLFARKFDDESRNLLDALDDLRGQ